MTRVSLFVHDLGSNPIVRAAPLGRALERAGFEVEVLGLLLGDEGIYSPYRDAFRYRVLESSYRPAEVMSRGRELADMATGEVHYAFKPFWTTYFPALIASGFGKRSPLLLDVEDEPFLYRKKSLLVTVAAEAFLDWGNIEATKYNAALHPFTGRAHAVSVVSRKLQSRYGGEILLHGPSRAEARPGRGLFEPRRGPDLEAFGLPEEAPVVGFAGVPRPHKGLDTVVEALEHPDLQAYHLALAGPESHPAFRAAADRLGRRCHVVGLLDHHEMPSFLSAIDVVPVVQRRNRVTEAQVPAKLLEAMAYRRVLVGSRVGDLPRLLGAGDETQRGWLVDPARADQLAAALREILQEPGGTRRRAERGRRFFEEQASVEGNAAKVEGLVGKAVDRFRAS